MVTYKYLPSHMYLPIMYYYAKSAKYSLFPLPIGTEYFII